jgi:hypothetical protein
VEGAHGLLELVTLTLVKEHTHLLLTRMEFGWNAVWTHFSQGSTEQGQR